VSFVADSSPFFGATAKAAAARYSNQVARWEAFGDVSRLALFLSPSTGCVVGAKPTYGADARRAALMGVEANATKAELALGAGEAFVKASYKGGAK
jgi:hypothetical protein